MSARKADSVLSSGIEASQGRLTLPATSIRIRSNGIEFRTSNPVPVWKEMVIELQSPLARNIHCSGVVVACEGNRHQGFVVAMVFTQVSKQALAALQALSSSPLN